MLDERARARQGNLAEDRSPMTMPLRLASLLLLLVASTSCGGGGGAPAAGAAATGRVMVIVDTRAGDEALVQFEVAGATLERADGTQTSNLLAAPAVVTFGDPSAAPAGLPLGQAPAGDYVGMHLVLTPSTGVAVTAWTTLLALPAPLSVRVPFEERIEHTTSRDTWVVAAHRREALLMTSSQVSWQPELIGRASGEQVELEGLTAPVLREGALYLTAFGDRTVRCSEGTETVYVDAGGAHVDREAFVDGLVPEDEFCVRGAIRRDGTLDLRRIARCGRQVRPRLIGHVQSVDVVEQTLVLRVQAANGPFGAVLLQTPDDILVRASAAALERPNGAGITLSAVTAGRLAKVRWSSRELGLPGLDEYVAEQVVVPAAGHGLPLQQWVGDVASVDLAQGVLVLEAREGAYMIQGQSVTSVEVLVDAATYIERRARRGGGSAPIPLAEVQPGVDRAWVRGEVNGAAKIDAAWLRVRAQ